MGTKPKKLLYEWAIENKRDDIIIRWDYDLNDIPITEVSASNGKSYYFKCENNLHDSRLHRIADVTRHNKVPLCPICNSFGTWCENNNRKDLLKRWDNELNTISPYEIPLSSKKKQYFKCPRGIHKSELKDINNIRKQYGSSRCYQCESIGQYGIDNISKNFIEEYWSDKNNVSPMQINKFSNKKIWIKCQEKKYHKDYDLTTVNFFKGKRCPYCSGKRMDILDSIGTLYPKSVNIWSKKNKKTPFDFLPQSNKNIYWKCENGIHNDYKRKISLSTRADFRCPQCVKERKESILQEKVRLYISSLYTDIRHEYNCTLLPRNPDTKYILPYDNEIVDLKLIIEVNGIQHYSKHSYNSYYKSKNKTPEEMFEQRQKYDKYKKEFALNSGYYFLEIPYWADNKNETWKKMINDKIKSIQNNLT